MLPSVFRSTKDQWKELHVREYTAAAKKATAGLGVMSAGATQTVD